MGARSLIVAAFSLAVVVCLSVAAWSYEGAFTNIARECGVETILNRRLPENAKWMLFDLELVDLDGDGGFRWWHSNFQPGQLEFVKPTCSAAGMLRPICPLCFTTHFDDIAFMTQGDQSQPLS
jgi:hypothetical protein